jgi:hypothetical protein
MTRRTRTMTRTKKRPIRPAFDDLEGRHLLSMTLPETSIAAPAIITFQDQITNNYAPYIAWTGTDAQHHLNIENLYTGIKRTLPDTSSAAPALAVFQGRLFLAWTGTDAQHHLNVESSADGLNFDHKTVLDAPPGPPGVFNGLNATTPASDGPALAPAPGGQALCIAWTGTDLRLNYTYAFDPFGQYWGAAHTLQLYSYSSPALDTYNGELTISWRELHGLFPDNSISNYSITYLTRTGRIPYQWFSNNGPSVATDDSSPGVSYLGFAWTDAATQAVYVYSKEFGDHNIFEGYSRYAPSLSVDYIPDDGYNYYVAWAGTDGYLHYDVL